MLIRNEIPHRYFCNAIFEATIVTVFALAFAGTLPAQQTNAAQQTGSLSVAVQVTATAGEPEPARGLSLYLLRKSFEDIRKEADAAEPPLDKNGFIEKLEVSPGLKEWMVKHQIVELSGPEFPKALTADDIFNVREFTAAFATRTNGDLSIQFPTAKYLKVNRQKQPEKYQQLYEEYQSQMRAVIKAHPEILDSLYLALEQENVDPGPRWKRMEMDRNARVRRRGLALAQSEYLVATATTDLDGRCMFGAVPSGNYWVTTLEIEAIAGDAHVRWDFPVRVGAGQSASVRLSSINGIVPGQ